MMLTIQEFLRTQMCVYYDENYFHGYFDMMYLIN